MHCPSCKAKISTQSLFCSACGARTGAAAVALAEMPNPQAEILLTDANLLRIRKQWEQAEAKCVDVMRLTPNNVHAHSLLGDIYRDQGRLDEAAQWYQMALDLDPNSGPDRAKLTAVEKQQSKQLARSGDTKRKPRPAGGVNLTGVTGTQSLMGLTPTSFFRLVWLLVGLFVVVVAVILIVTRNDRLRQPMVPTGTLPGTAVPPPTPETITGTLPARSTPGAAPMVGSPNSKPSTTDPRNTPTRPSPGAGPSGAPSSERDAALLAGIGQQAGLGPQAQVVSVNIDTREQKANIVLVEKLPNEPLAPEQVRELVIRDAAKAAQTAFGLDVGFGRVTVNVKVAAADRPAEPFFVGDLDRAGAQHIVNGSTPEQILSLFSTVWWAQEPTGVRPPGTADLGRSGGPDSNESQ